MTAEELQVEIQKLAPEGVKVWMSKNAATVTFQRDDSLIATEIEPRHIDETDPLVVAQALEFEVEVKTPRTKTPAKK